MSASFWLLDHLIYLKLRKKEMLTKWQLISLKIRTILSEHTIIISFLA